MHCFVIENIFCIKFNRFPKDPSTRIKWAEFCQKTISDLRDSHRLCENHFEKQNACCAMIPTIMVPGISAQTTLPREVITIGPTCIA